MRISEAMKPDDLLLGVSASSKDKLLQLLSEHAGAALAVSEETILTALRSRESLGSTGIGAGIAIPHAPVDGLVAPFVLLARLAKPVEFEAIDEEPVDVVCLILTPPGEQNRYLKLLSSVTRQLRSADTLGTIRQAADRERVYRTFAEVEG